jgi:FtsH-binding integral membrane protein
MKANLWNTKTRGETLVRINLGEKTSLVPSVLLYTFFILIFWFILSFDKTEIQVPDVLGLLYQ